MDNSFEKTLLDIANKSALSLMLSIGHRTKLFDVMSELPPSTSQDIASKANLNERYVREWLGSLVTSNVIDYEPNSKLFSLSKEKANLLSRMGSYNFAAMMQFVPVMAQVEDDVLKCFEKGGGVPYESFTRFHQVMAEESAQTVLPALIDKILPIVPDLVEQMKNGINVLDVGCGSGRALNLMASKLPKSKFTGFDFSSEAIEYAKDEAKKLHLSNISFEKKDVGSFSEPQKFDLITAFDAIHDQANPAKVLENISKSLKDDGVFLMQDIGASSKLEKNYNLPLAPFFYTISCLHCMTVSLALNGAGLGAMWGKELAIKMLNDAGFSNVEVKELPHDPINYYYIARKN